MTELERIADQLKRAYEGPAWSGPSLLEVLDGISAERAASRLIPGAHTIWEILAHIVAWEEVVTRRLQGERVREYSGDQDWPPVENTTASAWSALLKRLGQSNSELRQAVLAFDPTRLSALVPGGDYSFYVLMLGAVQHDMYHAGQIGILKKAA